MNVDQLMTRNVRTVRADQSACDAAKAMWEHDIGCVPVVDGDGRLAGMVTDRDICMAAYHQGKCLSEIPVRTAMANKPISCSTDESLVAVEERMRHHQIRRIPVIDRDRRVIGVLSINDLAREARREEGAPRRQVGGEEVATTLAAIGQPRGGAALASAPR